jgi:hypothetical protein
VSVVEFQQSARAHRRRTAQDRCSLDGCNQGRYARQLCVMHYTRLRRHGDVGEAGRIRNEQGSGYVNEYGYRVVHLPSHPLAEGRAQGKVEHHRVILFDAIGEGPHPCHWCERPLTWRGLPSQRISVDHLDHDRLNNDLGNLVPSCLDCNTKRTAS